MPDVNPDVFESSLSASRHRIEHLRSEGRRLRASLARSRGAANLALLSIWQRDCAAAISDLSGGVKAHWLARAFSNALLVPNTGTEAADVTTITVRILDVLERADASLAQATPEGMSLADSTPAAQRPRFTFIRNEELRASLERAYLDGRAAFTRGEFALALITYCSILETVITDALERNKLEGSALPTWPAGPVSDWSFSTRIEIAERARLVSGGCARLPGVARQVQGPPERERRDRRWSVGVLPRRKARERRPPRCSPRFRTRTLTRSSRLIRAGESWRCRLVPKKSREQPPNREDVHEIQAEQAGAHCPRRLFHRDVASEHRARCCGCAGAESRRDHPHLHGTRRPGPRRRHRTEAERPRRLGDAEGHGSRVQRPAAHAWRETWQRRGDRSQRPRVAHGAGATVRDHAFRKFGSRGLRRRPRRGGARTHQPHRGYDREGSRHEKLRS